MSRSEAVKNIMITLFIVAGICFFITSIRGCMQDRRTKVVECVRAGGNVSECGRSINE